MATTCDIITDSLLFTESLKGGDVAIVRDSLLLTDRITMSPGVIARDHIVLTDSMKGFETNVARDHIVFTETLLADVATADVARDHLRFTESLRAAVSDTASDSLTLTDSLIGPINFAIARDTLVLSDAVTNFAGGNVARDALKLHDRLVAQVVAILSDSLSLTDRMANVSRGGNVAADALVFGDSVAHLTAGADTARDLLLLTDMGLHYAAISNAARDEIFFRECLGPPLALAGAWTCSTDTFAMTRYIQPRIVSIDVVDDAVLVSMEDGIYLFAGADDAGTPILAHAETGLRQIGVPQARDINARDTGDSSVKATEGVAYIAHSGGRVRLGIGITRGGVEKTYWYPFPDRNAAAPTIDRVKIGRGAKSGFWRFLFENMDGDAFMVKEQRFILNPLSRRI